MMRTPRVNGDVEIPNRNGGSTWQSINIEFKNIIYKTKDKDYKLVCL